MEVAKEKTGAVEEFEEDDVASRRCMLDGEFRSINVLRHIFVSHKCILYAVHCSYGIINVT